MSVHSTDPVGRVAGPEPVFVDADATLRAVAHTLWSSSVGILVVGDARHVVGLVSERDVVTQLAQGADPDTRTARDAMTPYFVSARAEDPIYDAAGQMLDDAIRHLPVVDRDDRVVGMLSLRDVLRPLLLDALTAQPTGV